MSGKHGRLLTLVKNAAEVGKQDEFVEGVDFLLGSQFLDLPEYPGFAFQVVIGSGMGLLSSYDIPNYCFYELVEKHVLTEPFRTSTA